MTTTVNLDPDTQAALKQAMQATGESFDKTLNDAVKRGLNGVHRDPSNQAMPRRGLGAKFTGLPTHAEAELEVEELLARKLESK